MSEEERAALFRANAAARSQSVAGRFARLRGSAAAGAGLTAAWLPWLDPTQFDGPDIDDEPEILA